VTSSSLIIEITGDGAKIDGFVDVLKPLGIIEMVRTGAVAMERGSESLVNPDNGISLRDFSEAVYEALPS
jgi:acetolactate synthase I/III small subunit